MEEKITRELQIQMRTSSGPFRVSIRPKSSAKLTSLVSVNRYEGMSHERIKAIEEEAERLIAPICVYLDNSGLTRGKSYISDGTLRNVSALLTENQLLDLSKQDYVRQIGRNLQKDLPF